MQASCQRFRLKSSSTFRVPQYPVPSANTYWIRRSLMSNSPQPEGPMEESIRTKVHLQEPRSLSLSSLRNVSVLAPA